MCVCVWVCVCGCVYVCVGVVCVCECVCLSVCCVLFISVLIRRKKAQCGSYRTVTRLRSLGFLFVVGLNIY